LGLLLGLLLAKFWPQQTCSFTLLPYGQLDVETSWRRLERRQDCCLCGASGSSSRLATSGRATARQATSESAGPSMTVFEFEVPSAVRDAFKQSCLDFCKVAARKEQGVITRADLLRQEEDDSRFLLRVVHSSVASSLGSSPSYAAWRKELEGLPQGVADETEWQLLYPASSSYGTLILERSLPVQLEIRLLELVSKTAKQEKLAAAAVEYAKACSSAGILRVEVLRSVASPAKFVVLEVFESKAAEDSNVITEHYMSFEDVVGETMAMDPSLTSYTNLFPSVPAAWRRT